MKSNDDQKLEATISRELKALPELTAPASLANRVMAAIELRLNVPWYRRSWVTWPVGLRMASFVIMLVLFCGLYVAGWELCRTEMFLQAMHRIGSWLSGFNTVGNTLGILMNSVFLMVKKLGTPFMVAALISATLGYAMCLGLGTVFYRLAFSKQ